MDASKTKFKEEYKMRINNNIMSMNAHRQLGANQAAGAKSMERLSSGMRINRAGDDAAGLAISEKMRGQIRGLKQASRNAQDGISMIQTAEGSLNETHAILQRMRELATQSSNDTNTVEDRKEIQAEVDQLAAELTRIGDNTEFNTRNLLDGSRTVTFHIGANEGQNMGLKVGDMRAGALEVDGAAVDAVAAEGTIQGIEITAADGTNYNVSIVQGVGTSVTAGAEIDGDTIIVTLGTDGDSAAVGSTLTEVAGLINGLSGIEAKMEDGNNGSDNAVVAERALAGGYAAIDAREGGIDVSSQATANRAITVINDAIETVSAERSKLGATQNRLEHTISNLGTAAENLQAAESRIRDLDMAEEMMHMTRSNILNQAATAMMAQANAQPQSVLQLLG